MPFSPEVPSREVFFSLSNSFSSTNVPDNSSNYALSDNSNTEPHIIIYSTIDEKLSLDISNTTITKNNTNDNPNNNSSDLLTIHTENIDKISKINKTNGLSLNIKELPQKEDYRIGFCTII